MKKSSLLLISVLSLSSCDINQLIESVQKEIDSVKEEYSVSEIFSTSENESVEKASDAESNKIEISESFEVENSTSEIEIESETTSEEQTYSIYSITKGGEYTFKGKLEEGQIYVNAPEEEVKIYLDSVSLSNSKVSPIYIEDADKVVINSIEESYNEIIDSRELMTNEEDETEGIGKGAIYSRCDLNISGKGSLVVNASFNNGIHTTKDLKIKNVTLKVTAVNNAIKGNDSIEVESGNIIAISSGGDGFKTEDSDVSSKGNQRGTISFTGSTTTIYSACDGLDASYDCVIEDGANISIYTDKYSEYSGEVVSSSTSKMYISVPSTYYSTNYRYSIYYYNDDVDSGIFKDATYLKTQQSYGGRQGQSYSYIYEVDKPSSYQNFKLFRFASNAENSTTTYNACISGTVNSSRDMIVISRISSSTISASWSTYGQSSSTGMGPGGMGPGGANDGNQNKTDYSCKGIKADNSITINGGKIFVKSSDDSVHANADVTLENGKESIGTVTINGGELTLYTLDDGIHGDKYTIINGGNIVIENSYEGVEGNVIEINGGSTTLYASDDGVNAAGSYLSPSIKITGGFVDITIGTGDVDGIDSNGTFTMTGGVCISKGAYNSTSSMSSGLDCDSTATISGGTFICLGTMEKTPTSTLNYATSGQSSTGGFGGGRTSSSVVTITAGTYSISNTTISFTAKYSYYGINIYSDQLVKNNSYTLSNGTKSYSWTQSSQKATIS